MTLDFEAECFQRADGRIGVTSAIARRVQQKKSSAS